MRFVLLGNLTLGCAGLVLACAGLRLGASEREVSGIPADVVFATVNVFHGMGAPVEFSDPMTGTVRTGEFRVPDALAGEPRERVVDCGLDRHGQPREHGAVVWMSLEVHATQTAGHRSRVRLDARAGAVPITGEERLRCAVSAGFTTRVLDAIAAESRRYAG